MQWGLTKISERERVSKRVNRRNAVLPLPSRPAGKQIRRAWLQAKRRALPLAIGESLPQTKAARRGERKAHHIAEDRPILVPTDRCTRCVFRHKHLFQATKYKSRRGLNLVADIPKKGRNRIGRQSPVLIEVTAGWSFVHPIKKRGCNDWTNAKGASFEKRS